MSSSLASKATHGAIWASTDRLCNLGLQFIVNLVLARLLLPETFGAIGMITIFIAVSQTLIDGGFGTALIQKKRPTQEDFSTIFIWNVIFSTILYMVIYTISPIVSEFYNMPILKSVLRALGLNLILGSILSIQMTKLRKQLAFKQIAIINLSSYLLSGIISIFLAYQGYGIWSLVFQQLCYSILAIILVYSITRWKPKIIFSKKTIKELFGFGGYMLAASILQDICKNIQGVIIGKRFSATQMGYYTQAYKLDQVVSFSIPQIIVQVMYPVYSQLQDEKERLINIFSMNLRVISFSIYPIISLICIYSDRIIKYLYGDNWTDCVPYFQILCIGGLFASLQNINFYAVAAIGKSKALFQASFYKWGFLLLAMIVGMNFGMIGFIWSICISSFNIYLTNAYLVDKYLNYSIKVQLINILPIILLNITSSGIALLIQNLTDNPFISILIYLAFYTTIAVILRMQALNETKLLLLKLIKRND